jgi:hypothetical protein
MIAKIMITTNPRMIDYLNDIFDFEIEAGGTEFQATDASHSAIITLLQGDEWMIFRNTLTNVLHWDFVSRMSGKTMAIVNVPLKSVLGRIIAVPVADFQYVPSDFPLIYS